MILPVVLAGGSGTRLWPLSRAKYPKQFLNIVGDNTMLQDTVLRLKNIDTVKPVVICNTEHRFLVAEQMQNIGQSADIILEPVGRNTAPAIALAALKAIEDGDDPIMLILAADHVIQNISAFEKAVKKASKLSETGKLVTFGIVPDSPETGYGYIHRAEACNAGGYIVNKFVEKPDEVKAKEYIETDEFYWNSGMFLFKSSQYLNRVLLNLLLI
jgi:mannose-1-phosphate guanylyltransferase